MFGNGYSSEKARQEGCNLRLRAVLQAWPTPEPRIGFEATVWRRIHPAAAGTRPIPERSHVLGWLAYRSAWVNALAAAAGIAVGVGLAVAGSGDQAGRRGHDALLHPQTLAGSYLTLVNGGAR